MHKIIQGGAAYITTAGTLWYLGLKKVFRSKEHKLKLWSIHKSPVYEWVMITQWAKTIQEQIFQAEVRRPEAESLSQASLCFCHQSELMTHMKYLQTKQLEKDILQKSMNYSSAIVWKAFFVSPLYCDAGGVQQLGLLFLWCNGCFSEELLSKWRSQMQDASSVMLPCCCDRLTCWSLHYEVIRTIWIHLSMWRI